MHIDDIRRGHKTLDDRATCIVNIVIISYVNGHNNAKTTLSYSYTLYSMLITVLFELLIIVKVAKSTNI